MQLVVVYKTESTSGETFSLPKQVQEKLVEI